MNAGLTIAERLLMNAIEEYVQDCKDDEEMPVFKLESPVSSASGIVSVAQACLVSKFSHASFKPRFKQAIRDLAKITMRLCTEQELLGFTASSVSFNIGTSGYMAWITITVPSELS